MGYGREGESKKELTDKKGRRTLGSFGSSLE